MFDPKSLSDSELEACESEKYQRLVNKASEEPTEEDIQRRLIAMNAFFEKYKNDEPLTVLDLHDGDFVEGFALNNNSNT